MNDNDIRYETVWTIYNMYLECHEKATTRQARLADNMFYYLSDLQKDCDLYKNDKIKRPEDYIKETKED